MAGSSGDPRGPITGINITPLVDVCLVLVIIFMVTAPLMMQPTLPVELPKAKTREGKETDNITITINRIAGNRVTLGVDAPGHVHILRGELQRTSALLGNAEEAIEWELAGSAI